MNHQVEQPGYVRMDPRIRQRRVEVRRRQGRRRLRILLAVLLILILTVAGWLALRSPLFDVDLVKVEGAARTPPQRVIEASGIRPGQAMLDIDLTAAARRVEALPWVGQAAARRDWPGTVRIAVQERAAVGVTRSATDGWALLDATGRVLEEVAGPPPGLTVLEGLPPVPAAGTPVPGAEDPLAVVATLTPSLKARTAAVVVVGEGQLALRLNPRGTVRLGPPADIEAKVRAAETVLAQVDVGNLAVLDVRYPSSPVLTRV